MTKRITSLFLVLALCMTFFPVMASAAESEEPEEEPIKTSITSITTVDKLLEFAKDVNEGKYDDKTDAIVSLDADLDLTGVAWTPIGSVFAADGTLQHYFSGKFYGNGHTISNLDFSENYGKTEYPSFGFFSEVYDAEISGLTIQGNLDVSNSGRVYFGTVAGVAADSTISDCVSNVSFTDTGKYINGTAAMCGYAINSTIEHCQNKGNFSITMDTTSFQMGGIVGLAQNSTVQYCANTGEMTSWTPCTGGIVGQLFQNSKIINCYSTGKMVPLGIGNTDFGGIAGIVGAGTEIKHCYFAGEMDLSGYTATITPPATAYSRLGGIVGQVSSGTPTFSNNYFRETEKVAGCVKGAGDATAGTAKTADYMKTEGFYNELKAGDGDYIYIKDSTPILPAPKYTVSFDIKPTDLTGVTVKIGEETLDLNTKKIELAAGAYNVTVGATFSKEIKITANHATHTQQLNLTANYTAVDAAIEKAKALNESDYRNFDTVKAAIAAVVRDKNIAQQAEVDAMAKVIENAINGLVRKSSGSSSSGSGNTTTKTETTTNPDGSTTKTETKKDGSVTETTTGTDGSVTKTETKTDTKSDGSKTETKTETKTDADGNKTTSKTETTTDKSGTVTESKTETKTDADGTKTEVKSETKKDQNGVTTGTETVKETLPNGSTGTTTTTTDANGTKTEAVTTISSKAVDEAKKNDEAVTVPVDVKATEDSQTAPTVKVELPKNSGETKVEIPVSNVTPGTVVAVVKPDGTEEIVKDCIPTENGIQLAVEDNVTLKVFDNAKDFTDTKGHWAEPYIDFASARELLNGISEDTFAPEQPTTRAMMWTVLARQDDTDLSGGTTWYDKAQAWAKDSGVSDGTAPQANVTRAQMVTMLWRAAGSPAPQTMSSFADVSADAYYAAAVAWAAEQGITNGVSATQFQPNGACTRAQIAAFLYRASLEN